MHVDSWQSPWPCANFTKPYYFLLPVMSPGIRTIKGTAALTLSAHIYSYSLQYSLLPGPLLTRSCPPHKSKLTPETHKVKTISSHGW